jgi:hypothetical protein
MMRLSGQITQRLETLAVTSHPDDGTPTTARTAMN